MRSALLAALLLVAPPAVAQSSGSYGGTLACERMQGRAASNAPFQLTVDGGQASYAREVLAVDGSPMGMAEEAKVAIAPDGMLTLAATIEAGSFHYEARYEGRLGEASGKLAGTQTWWLGKDPVARKCTLTLNRRAAAAPPRGRPAQGKPAQEKPGQEKPPQERSSQERPVQERPVQERTAQDKPAQPRPARRPAQERPAQERSGQERSGQERPALNMNVPLDLPPPR